MFSRDGSLELSFTTTLANTVTRFDLESLLGVHGRPLVVHITGVFVCARTALEALFHDVATYNSVVPRTHYWLHNTLLP